MKRWGPPLPRTSARKPQQTTPQAAPRYHSRTSATERSVSLPDSGRCGEKERTVAHPKLSCLTVKRGDESAAAGGCDPLLHRRSKRDVEVILTEIPSCLAPRVAEEVVQNRTLRLVQLAGHAPVTIVQKKALDVVKEIVGGKQEPHLI